ncbi:MAG: Lrp/AsnC ligand binding domain-containing protein [Bacteroidia bacterium]|nr:Lrp/AsnC ligand binding domain-containing protein [Bacteroidia bacterium]
MYFELKNQFDPLDIEIMDALVEDARIPFSRLAEQLRVSNSLIHQRVRKLKEAGVLRNPAYRLDPVALGYETCAFTQILLLDAKYMNSTIAQLKEIPEIVECVNIAGRYAIMVKIYAVNNFHLRDVIYEKIQSIEGVEGTNTLFSFDTPFERSAPLRIEKKSRLK